MYEKEIELVKKHIILDKVPTGNPHALALLMVLYGTSYALLFPSISAIVADYTTPDERGRASGVFHALLTVGVALGAPVMGWVAETVGIKWGLALCGGAAALALPVVLTALRQRQT